MFQIDNASRVPIYEQLMNSIISLAAAGVLKPGDKLPPVRNLAAQVGINPNTVARTYRELEQKGYIYTAVGRGSFISEKLFEDNEQRLAAAKTVRRALQKAKSAGIDENEMKRIVDEVYRGGKIL